jgi:hypothetical protein
MKRLITLILVVCSLAAFSADPVKYYTKTEADARYPQISQGFQLEDSVYFKDQIDALFLEKTIGMYNLLIGLGSDVKGIPVGANFANTSNVALADNIQYFGMCYVPKDTTVTGIRFVQAVAGNYTPDNTNGIALYSFSGTTYTKVVETTNDTADPNIFEATANTVVTKAFSTPTHIAKGFYAVSFLYNSSAQTTAPSLSGINTTVPMVFSKEFVGTAMHIAAQTSAGQNSFPSTMTVANTVRSGQSFSFILY